jgi:phage/plasmid primase-like uncharacterized protein
MSLYSTYLDTEQSFRKAMEDVGITPPNMIVPDGQIHRFSTNKNPRDTAGWYVLYEGEVNAGSFGDWRLGHSHKWFDKSILSWSEPQKKEYKSKLDTILRKQEQERKSKSEEATNTALELWKKGSEASNQHPYLLKKQIKSHGIRMQKDSLMIPMYHKGSLVSIQQIDSKGNKRFLKGGKVKGACFWIGKIEEDATEPICIVEGYATGASVYESTDYPVCIAFSSGNLLLVAEMIRAKYPMKEIVLCADNDSHTQENVGLAKAKIAASTIQGKIAIPHFEKNTPKGVTDFNDLHCLQGKESVKTCIDKSYLEQNVSQYEWGAIGKIVSELKPVSKFDADKLLPDVLKTWVLDESSRMPCSPDFIATATLVVLGSLIGTSVVMKPKRNDPWCIVPNLWGGIVGDPSCKKSPAYGVVVKLLDRLVKTAQKENKELQSEYQIQKKIYEAKQDALEKRLKKAVNPSSGEDMEDIVREIKLLNTEVPKAPYIKRYKTNDSTVEKLGELLCENPKGLLVLRDELVGLLRSWEKVGHEGDRTFFLEAWNGSQSFDTDRIGRGHVSIPNLCVSLFGGIQPDKLTMYLEGAMHAMENDGLLPRFQLLVYPDVQKWKWTDREPNKEANTKVYSVFEKLADIDPIYYGATPSNELVKFPHFKFDEKAQKVFVKWSTYWHTEKIPKEEEPVIQQHLTKFDKLFPALVLIFHLVDCVTDNKTGDVSKEATERAMAWCEYLEVHARRCYGLVMDGGCRAAQALASKIKKGSLENGFTLRDVRRQNWKHLTVPEMIEGAIAWLIEEQWIRGEETVSTSRGGRNTTKYHINPSLLNV